jgi:hypothetical protein
MSIDEKDEWVLQGCVVISERMRQRPGVLSTEHLSNTKHLRAHHRPSEAIPAGMPSDNYTKYNYASLYVARLTPRDIYYQRGLRIRLLNLKDKQINLEDDEEAALYYKDNVVDYLLRDLVAGDQESARSAKVYFEEIFEVPDLTPLIEKPSIVRNLLMKLGKSKLFETKQMYVREYPHLGLF